jgi:hypothetical protein
MALWYILWQLVIVYGYSLYFFPFWYVVPRKIWQPCMHATNAHSDQSSFYQRGFFSVRPCNSSHAENVEVEMLKLKCWSWNVEVEMLKMCSRAIQVMPKMLKELCHFFIWIGACTYIVRYLNAMELLRITFRFLVLAKRAAVMIVLIFSPKNLAKGAFLTQNKVKLCKN